ncbi:MAG: o-succinylbenzoate synthase [Actinomycetales bacterium]
MSIAPSRPPVPLPELEELMDAAYVVRLPLRLRFRGLTEREVLLLDGPHGWGEFGPFTEYDDAESARWLAAGVESGWGSWPEPVRRSVPVNATVPAISAQQVPGVLARFPGSTTVKVKVAEAGQTVEDDVARVAAVVDVLGADLARLRVDANGRWTVAEARDALRRLRDAAGAAVFEYAEQPCATVPELAELRIALAADGVEVPIAADESVRKADDPLAVAIAGAADVVVVKVAPLGGVLSALVIADQLRAEHGLPAVVSSALDTSVGIGAGVALAAALPDLSYACGLGTVTLFESDVSAAPLVPRDGAIDVRRGVVDPDRMAALAAAPERATWWRERLERCYQVLAAGFR